ncbi:MAG TPA: trypsin-like serine protease [Bacteriovoracaceae bacterium]|nr:trypsin-like serine protease [Bacteriovoracaceae bacterium]
METQVVKLEQYNLESGKEGEATCNGDSGGPMFMSYQDELFQVGITSRGTKPYCKGGTVGTLFYGPETLDFP